MGIVIGILIFIEIVVCILMIGIILLQKAKDQGLGLAFGAGVGETLFGSRAGNVLTKITVGLAIVFLANTLLIGYIWSGTKPRSLVDRLPAERTAPAVPSQPPASEATIPIPSAESTPAPAPTPAPVAPVAPAPAPAAP